LSSYQTSVVLPKRAERSWIKDVIAEAARNKLVVIGFVMAFLFIALAIFAPVIAPYAPNKIIGIDRLKPPSITHIFGADHLGRDVFSRVVFGIQTSLIVSIVSVFLGSAFGTLLGLIAGYAGGTLDTIICRILDVFFGIPTLLLAMALSGILGSGIINPIIAISIVNIPFFARLVRGPTLVEKTKLYTLAAQAIGASAHRIILMHILPNVIPLVIVQSTVSLAYAILIEASLGFVGLGVQPPTPSLGSMLSEGRTYLEIAPWYSIFPGLAIMVMVLAFNLTGDGLRDALDPTNRGRH
jgi:peptide/nickel transport system permease protein